MNCYLLVQEAAVKILRFIVMRVTENDESLILTEECEQCYIFEVPPSFYMRSSKKYYRSFREYFM
jgi:hypothetical protein